MKNQALLAGPCALFAVLAASAPMTTTADIFSTFLNSTIGNNVTLGALQETPHLAPREYVAPRAMRCDIDESGPTGHGDGYTQLINILKERTDKPPTARPDDRLDAGCYFGAGIWWANTDPALPVIFDSWDMIWRAVEDIKTQCMHLEWPPLPCCMEIEHHQVSGIAQYENYVVWIHGGAKCSTMARDAHHQKIPNIAMNAATAAVATSITGA